MNLLARRALIAVAATLGLALVLALLAGQYIVCKHQWAEQALEQIEPRHARLLGLREAGGALEEALKQAKSALSGLGYPNERDSAQVGNDLQQTARRALQAAGLSVASSQVQAPLGEAGYERVRVLLQAEGALSGVQLALAALQTESPRLTFDSVLLQSTGRTADDGTPIVSCRLTVSVVRLQS